MKQLLFATLMLLCITAGAQSNLPLAIEDAGMNNYLQNRKPATLTIQINNAPDSIKNIDVKYTLVIFGANFQVTKYAQTNANGFAEITLNQNLPYQQIWLHLGDYLYAGVYVNTDLTVTIDASKIKKDGVFMIGDGVSYSGTDGELNTVMNKQVLYKKEEENKLSSNLNRLCTSRKQYSADSFFQKTDSIYEALNKIDDEFIEQFPNYEWAIKNETASQFYGELCVAYWGDTMPKKLFDKINEHKPFFTSNDGVLFYNYLNNYILYKKDNPKHPFNDNILFKDYAHYNAERKELLDSLKYYKQLSVQERKEKTVDINIIYQRRQRLFGKEMQAFYMDNYIHLIDSIYTKPKSDILKISLLDKGKNAFAQTYPEILNSTETKWCRQIISNELTDATIKQKKIDSLLATATQLNDNTEKFIGVPLEKLPFDANLYRLDSVKNVDDFIINLKSKFKGKALFIDFWATWCAPCLADLPFSKKLHEANKDLPLAYIYICTNASSNIDLWKNKVADLQLPGTHIFMDEKIVSKLKSSFNNTGSGFPTYVVIDVNGKLRPKAIQSMQLLDKDKLKTIIGL